MLEEAWQECLRRESYLSRLRPLYDDCDLVKVLTGVRRCGKSVLMRQVADELRAKASPERVIEINFELATNSHIASADDLDRFVMSQVDDTHQIHYVLLDEVQEVPGFEKGVNSLRARGHLSVFITGSNAHLLSGDLATYLAGRYQELRVWPLNYGETLELRELRGAPIPDPLQDYLAWGGLPHRFGLGQEESWSYLRDVFNSVVLRDVVQRTGLRDVAGLETIIDFALENLGRTLSPTSLSDYLKSQHRAVSTETIYSYLRALSDALLLNRVRRYDLRGKKVMATLDKYYATDVGILASKRVGNGPGLGDLIENAVYTHLAAREFDVYTGKTRTGEIDFVAVKGGRPRYVQVAYLLASDEVAAREFGAFAQLRDGYPRYLVTLDPLTQDRDGVTHLKLEDFLLRPPSDLA
ncbi:MAG: ATP-binding protein [Propionibacteriaceae bacterium]|nr:ATP-binding protein [Propionibacteriaceae bacterium]